MAHSKLTAQGQISVPAAVRKKLGLAPGSTIEWIEEGDAVVVRRGGQFSFVDINKTLFPKGPPTEKVDVKEAIRTYIRRKHARD